MLMLWFVSAIPSLWVNIYEEVIRLCSFSLLIRVILVLGLSFICIFLGAVSLRWIGKKVKNWWNDDDDE
jgi:hypothetical protein